MSFFKRFVCLAFLSTPGLFPAAAALPSESIYNLQASLVSQSGESIGLDVYDGHPVLVTMFYGSCPAACPLLIDALRAVERTLDATQRAQLRVLMISIDPVRDTSAALLKLSHERRIELPRWTLAHTDPAAVRKIAAALSIQYRQMPDGDFNHSSVISLLSSRGEILHQTSTLGKADAALAEAVRLALAPRR
jgi:protein SCO1/2